MEIPKVTPPKDIILTKMTEASQLLAEAHSVGLKANAMASDVPAFVRLQALTRDVNMLVLEISKLRGLN